MTRNGKYFKNEGDYRVHLISKLDSVVVRYIFILPVSFGGYHQLPKGEIYKPAMIQAFKKIERDLDVAEYSER